MEESEGSLDLRKSVNEKLNRRNQNHDLKIVKYAKQISYISGWCTKNADCLLDRLKQLLQLWDETCKS